MASDQTEHVEWRDGRTPVSTLFDDPYFSLSDGYGETRHVFLDGNELPGRFKPDFQIAELGFGTGLNMFAALALWQKSGVAGPLRFTSFEAYPMLAEDMETALAGFADLSEVAAAFIQEWRKGVRRIETPDLIADIIIGDARSNLPAWQGQADAWFLDGFSPAKNPELWGDELLRDVGRHTAPGGTFATYTAAGHVREKLTTAGYQVSRIAGYGRKRHMSVGHLPNAGSPIAL